MIEQGSPEWHALRCGKITASRLIDIVRGFGRDGKRSNHKASRADYIMEKVIERMTGRQEEGFESEDMRNGKINEPLARCSYEAELGVIVTEVPFIDHPEISGLGYSPDGLVGDDGLIEIKCPKPKEHVRNMLTGDVKRDYIYQMQTGLFVTGRKWCDFVSYCPKMPVEHQLYIKRFERDDDIISEIEVEVGSVLAEIDFMIDKLNARVK